jgi:predicted TIM-barrel fold metal-dependent hydrolase
MIIDLNAHLGHYPFRRLRHNTPEALLALMGRVGIDKAVVSSIHSVFYRDAHAGNEELAEAAARAKGRLIPLATINPAYAGWERDMAQALDEWRMKGLRLVPQFHGYRLSDPTAQAALSAATERNVPVALHQRLEDRRQKHHFDLAEDLALEEVLAGVENHPKLRLMLLNWLGLPGAALAEAGLSGRVLIDFARMPVVLQKTVPALIGSLGAGALAFGTHVPFDYPGPALVKLGILDVSASDRQRIAWRNAAAFLSLDAV